MNNMIPKVRKGIAAAVLAGAVSSCVTRPTYIYINFCRTEKPAFNNKEIFVEEKIAQKPPQPSEPWYYAEPEATDSGPEAPKISSWSDDPFYATENAGSLPGHFKDPGLERTEKKNWRTNSGL
ncbi:hypothetical protein JXA56_05910 [Candidatus Micrarchaeota archaeon]|nr:hypothetical protein [Candidatus Micrarchaeota archaeon]